MTVGTQLSFRQAWLLAEVEKKQLELLRKRFRRLSQILGIIPQKKK